MTSGKKEITERNTHLSPGERYQQEVHEAVRSAVWESQQKAVYGKLPAAEKRSADLPAAFCLIPILLFFLILVLIGMQIRAWSGGIAAIESMPSAEAILQEIRSLWEEEPEESTGKPDGSPEQEVDAKDVREEKTPEQNGETEDRGGRDNGSHGKPEEPIDRNANKDKTDRLQRDLEKNDPYHCISGSAEEICAAWRAAGFEEDDIYLDTSDEDEPLLMLYSSDFTEDGETVSVIVMEDRTNRYLMIEGAGIGVLPEGMEIGQDRSTVRSVLSEKYDLSPDYEDETQLVLYTEEGYFCFSFGEDRLIGYSYRLGRKGEGLIP